MESHIRALIVGLALGASVAAFYADDTAIRSGHAVSAQDDQAGSNWALTDLRTLADTSRARHPKLRDARVRQSFDSVVQLIERNITALPRHRAILELAHTLAILEDGHTQLGLAWDRAIGFRRYPIRVFLFDEGVYVVGAAEEATILLGKRIVRIGKLPIDSVIQRVRPFLHGDNDMNRRDLLETRLTLYEVLETVGATRDPLVSFVVEDSSGRLDSLTLAPLSFGTDPTLVTARDTTRPVPLFLIQTKHPFWFAVVPRTRTIYAQISAIQNSSDHTLASFADSLFGDIDRYGLERLVLDIRFNNGGDNTLNRALVRRIIQATNIDQTWQVLRYRGSEDVFGCCEPGGCLENLTNAIFVGEPGWRPALL